MNHLAPQAAINSTSKLEVSQQPPPNTPHFSSSQNPEPPEQSPLALQNENTPVSLDSAPTDLEIWRGEITYLLHPHTNLEPQPLSFRAVAVGAPNLNIQTHRWSNCLARTAGFKPLPRDVATYLYRLKIPFGQMRADPSHGTEDGQKWRVFQKLILAGWCTFYGFPIDPTSPTHSPVYGAYGILFFSSPQAPGRVLFKAFVDQSCPAPLARDGAPAEPGMIVPSSSLTTLVSASGTIPSTAPQSSISTTGAVLNLDIATIWGLLGTGEMGEVMPSTTPPSEMAPEGGAEPGVESVSLGANISPGAPGSNPVAIRLANIPRLSATGTLGSNASGVPAANPTMVNQAQAATHTQASRGQIGPMVRTSRVRLTITPALLAAATPVQKRAILTKVKPALGSRRGLNQTPHTLMRRLRAAESGAPQLPSSQLLAPQQSVPQPPPLPAQPTPPTGPNQASAQGSANNQTLFKTYQRLHNVMLTDPAQRARFVQAGFRIDESGALIGTAGVVLDSKGQPGIGATVPLKTHSMACERIKLNALADPGVPGPSVATPQSSAPGAKPTGAASAAASVWRGQIAYLLQQRLDQEPAPLHFPVIAAGMPNQSMHIGIHRWPSRLSVTTGFKALPPEMATQLYSSQVPFGQISIDPSHANTDVQKWQVFQKIITAGWRIFYEFPADPANPTHNPTQGAHGVLFFSTSQAPGRILFKAFVNQLCPALFIRGGKPAGPGLTRTPNPPANGTNPNPAPQKLAPATGAGPNLDIGTTTGLPGAGPAGSMPGAASVTPAIMPPTIPDVGMVPGAGAGTGARPHPTPTPPNPSPTPSTAPTPNPGGMNPALMHGLNPANAMAAGMSGINPAAVPGLGAAGMPGLNPGVAPGLNPAPMNPALAQAYRAMNQMALARLGITPAQLAAATPVQKQAILGQIQQMMVRLRATQQQSTNVPGADPAVEMQQRPPGMGGGQPSLKHIQAYIRQQQR